MTVDVERLKRLAAEGDGDAINALERHAQRSGCAGPCNGGWRGCSGNATFFEHECPFQAEINDDSEFQCSCCPECEHECMMEV